MVLQCDLETKVELARKAAAHKTTRLITQAHSMRMTLSTNITTKS